MCPLPAGKGLTDIVNACLNVGSALKDEVCKQRFGIDSEQQFPHVHCILCLGTSSIAKSGFLTTGLRAI